MGFVCVCVCVCVCSSSVCWFHNLLRVPVGASLNTEALRFFGMTTWDPTIQAQEV